MSAKRGCGHEGGAICATCRVRSISICAALSGSELAALSALARDVGFAPGEQIVAQGDASDAVFNITDGVVRLVRTMADGRRQIVGFLFPGDFLGLALARTQANAAEAVGAVRACRFDRTRFEALLARFPNLLERLHQAAAHELSVAQDHVVALGRQTAEERVAGFVLNLSERRARAGEAADFVPLPMSRQDMADHLGLTIETVSRTLSKLVRSDGLAVTKGGVRLLAPGRLKDLAATT